MTVYVKLGDQEYQYESFTLDEIIRALFENQKSENINQLSTERIDNILDEVDPNKSHKLARITNDDGHTRQMGLTIDLYENAEVLNINEKQYKKGAVTFEGKHHHYAKDTGQPLEALLSNLVEQDKELQVSSEEQSNDSSQQEEYRSLSPEHEVIDEDATPPLVEADMEEFMSSNSVEEQLLQSSDAKEIAPQPIPKGSSPAQSQDSSQEESPVQNPVKDKARWSMPSLSDFKWPSLVASVASFAARSFSALTLGGLLSTPVVGLISFVGTYLGQVVRENFKKSSHKEVLAQTTLDDFPQQKLVNMDEPTWQAAKHGFEAQKSFLNQFKSCATPGDWTHAKAFYAGYRHSEIDPQLDLESVEELRKASLKKS